MRKGTPTKCEAIEEAKTGFGAGAAPRQAVESREPQDLLPSDLWRFKILPLLSVQDKQSCSQVCRYLHRALSDEAGPETWGCIDLCLLTHSPEGSELIKPIDCLPAYEAPDDRDHVVFTLDPALHPVLSSKVATWIQRRAKAITSLNISFAVYPQMRDPNHFPDPKPNDPRRSCAFSVGPHITMVAMLLSAVAAAPWIKIAVGFEQGVASCSDMKPCEAMMKLVRVLSSNTSASRKVLVDVDLRECVTDCRQGLAALSKLGSHASIRHLTVPGIANMDLSRLLGPSREVSDLNVARPNEDVVQQWRERPSLAQVTGLTSLSCLRWERTLRAGEAQQFLPMLWGLKTLELPAVDAGQWNDVALSLASLPMLTSLEISVRDVAAEGDGEDTLRDSPLKDLKPLVLPPLLETFSLGAMVPISRTSLFFSPFSNAAPALRELTLSVWCLESEDEGPEAAQGKSCEFRPGTALCGLTALTALEIHVFPRVSVILPDMSPMEGLRALSVRNARFISFQAGQLPADWDLRGVALAYEEDAVRNIRKTFLAYNHPHGDGWWGVGGGGRAEVKDEEAD